MFSKRERRQERGWTICLIMWDVSLRGTIGRAGPRLWTSRSRCSKVDVFQPQIKRLCFYYWLLNLTGNWCRWIQKVGIHSNWMDFMIT